MVSDGQPGGRRNYSHAIIALKLGPSDTEKEVNVVFRRGVTVKGELVGPDGRPAPETWMFGRCILSHNRLGTALGSWRGRYHGLAREWPLRAPRA